MISYVLLDVCLIAVMLMKFLEPLINIFLNSIYIRGFHLNTQYIGSENRILNIGSLAIIIQIMNIFIHVW
jgi:hypothetical protein